jgi:NAD(P)-dependent dehydrogenase (short-subunit alcohol dehydrogenase family)
VPARGIGRGIAALMAREGARVVVCHMGADLMVKGPMRGRRRRR